MRRAHAENKGITRQEGFQRNLGDDLEKGEGGYWGSERRKFYDDAITAAKESKRKEIKRVARHIPDGLAAVIALTLIITNPPTHCAPQVASF